MLFKNTDILVCAGCANYFKNRGREWVNNPHHVYSNKFGRMIGVKGQYYFGCSGIEDMSLGTCLQYDLVKLKSDAMAAPVAANNVVVKSVNQACLIDRSASSRVVGGCNATI